jgi:hypothetical protein
VEGYAIWGSVILTLSMMEVRLPPPINSRTIQSSWSM